ncbi:YggS family pyridoxal phosphate-dependent enzyme [Haliovirga abyssi]|uniref:Pyridoxal phosphate homeostasis protein n=1 Tax=Haliovirga abyssi TaxID=2996794 RepID=A0AAU9D514_9FUSO|nr:YggS family pyridoxal phosphate-dependent enzyme [Haliovirga abyssi]BDU51146.1 YggS family pyridoxal phosphate enzyme [Haliovirga abyssi]
MSVAENIKLIKEDIKKYSKNPDKVKIIAATKYVDYKGVEEVLEAGIKNAGENRVQALREKREILKEKDINWNFIGHLQKNKIKYIIDYIFLIHSVDSLGLAKEINKKAEKIDRVVDILLEVNISGEKSKSGYNREDLENDMTELLKLKNINIKGLMTMAPLAEDNNIVRKVFRELRELEEELNENYFNGRLTELSMGMTNDYKIALEEGATMIRIGSKIFL